MAILLALTVFLATGLVALAVYWTVAGRDDSLSRRFREIAGPREDLSGARAEEGAGWIGRVLGRFRGGRSATDEIAAIVSARNDSAARLLLGQAGYRSPGASQVYLWARIGLPVFLLALGLAGGKSAGLANPQVGILAAAGLIGGMLLPNAFLRMKARRRQEEITDTLPDAIDLLVVCVEAGLGLNAAFVKITEEFRLSAPTLSEEFDVVNREMTAGKPRTEALRAIAERTGVEDLKSLVAMLIQTEKLGTSLGQSLRVHSDSLRTKRRQRAEESAAKTTIKLVFPLVFLLFPALFIVILGPGAIQIVRVLLPVSAAGG